MENKFDNTNRGAIWGNNKKTSDTHPDWTGSLDVDGKQYWVSAWKRKEGASPSSPVLSFSVKAKDQPSENVTPAPEPTSYANKDDPFNDNIPF